MANIDTNIDSYSINELKNIFNIENNFDKSILEKNYNSKLKQLQELDNNETKNNLEKFFTNVYDFLSIYYTGLVNNNQVNNNNELLEKINNLENKLSILNEEKQNTKEHIYNVNQVNESNIKVNSITYNNIKKQLSINSQFRKITSDPNHNSCNFIVELPETINNVTSLELVSSEIPSLNYTFSEAKDNNKFKIKMYYIDPTSPPPPPGTQPVQISSEYDITIPEGVWFATDFETYLSDNYFDVQYNNNQINDYLRYLKFEIPTWSAKPLFRFKTEEEIETFNTTNPGANLNFNRMADTNNKFGFSLENISTSSLCINNDKTINIYNENQLDEVNFSLSCLGTIGFTLEDTYNSTNNNFIKIEFSDSDFTYNESIITYYGYLQAKNIYGHSNESSFYISVNDFVGNQSQQLILLGHKSTLVADDVLSRIQITSSPFQNNIYSSLQNYSIKRNYNGPVRIRKLHIKILDKYGRLIDLHDYPTNFVFEFTTQYSSEKFI